MPTGRSSCTCLGFTAIRQGPAIRLTGREEPGVRVDDPYGYERAFKYSLESSDSRWLEEAIPDVRGVTVLDPTAGGGSIPFETLRIGLTSLGKRPQSGRSLGDEGHGPMAVDSRV